MIDLNTRKLKLALNKIKLYHGEQLRKDGSKYNNHLFEVVSILKSIKNINREILIAGLLHDIIEDTPYTEEELLYDFDELIYTIVLECSDNKDLPKYERKLFQVAKVNFLKDESRLVKIADKISNLNSILKTPPIDWDYFRIIGYIAWTNIFIKSMEIRNDNEKKLISKYKRLYKKIISHYNYDYKNEKEIYKNYINYLKDNFNK